MLYHIFLNGLQGCMHQINSGSFMFPHTSSLLDKYVDVPCKGNKVLLLHLIFWGFFPVSSRKLFKCFEKVLHSQVMK